MEQQVFIYPKTNEESLSDAHDKGAGGKTSCTPKQKY